MARQSKCAATSARRGSRKPVLRQGKSSDEREFTTYERSSSALPANPGGRSSKDKRSNRRVVPERGVVGTCVRKGKHNDFETRIGRDGAI